MAIKAILFDFDNTLYDYDFAHDKALKSAFKEAKKHMTISYKSFTFLYETTKKEIHRELGGTAAAHSRTLYFQRIIEKKFKTIKPELVLRLYETYWKNLLNNMKLKQNVIETLKFCKKNKLKTAIVTDLTANIQLRKLKKLNIRNYIDAFVTSEEAGSEKPHSIMFLLTLNKLGILPKETIMVGDNAVADIEGANFVGINTVLLQKRKINEKTIKTVKKKVKSDFIINDMGELQDIINKFNMNKHNEEGYLKFNCHFKKTKPISNEKIKKLNQYRQKLYELGLVGAYTNKIGYGNLSERNNKTIIITGTATGNYKTLDNTCYSRLTNYNIKKNEIFCTGPVKASSESMTHIALYECSKNIGAIIHVHDLKMWKKYLNKLPTTSKTATYGTPELADDIKRLYKTKDFKEKKIAILSGHKEGIIAFGKNLKEAYDTIISYLEKTYPKLKIAK